MFRVLLFRSFSKVLSCHGFGGSTDGADVIDIARGTRLRGFNDRLSGWSVLPSLHHEGTPYGTFPTEAPHRLLSRVQDRDTRPRSAHFDIATFLPECLPELSGPELVLPLLFTMSCCICFETAQFSCFAGLLRMTKSAQAGLREYFLNDYKGGGVFEHDGYEHNAEEWCWIHKSSGIKVWEDALDLTQSHGTGKVECVFHYTTQSGFRNITAESKKAVEVFASLVTEGPDANAWWGKGGTFVIDRRTFRVHFRVVPFLGGCGYHLFPTWVDLCTPCPKESINSVGCHPLAEDREQGAGLHQTAPEDLTGLLQPGHLYAPTRSNGQTERGQEGPEDALNWAGVDGDLAQRLQDGLGGVQRVREVALIARVIWDRTVMALTVPELPDPNVMGPPNVRHLTPVEAARVESFRRVCLIRVGRPPDEPGGGMPLQQAGPAGAPFPPAGGQPLQGQGHQPGQGQAPSTTRRLKLSAILDPCLDADIIPLSPEEIGRMYEDYRRRFGDHPGSDSDPSGDQLAALKQVLASGAVPFACFTTWGPHGQRLLRKQTFTGFQLNVATGEWSKREQPGPASFHAWYKCWRVHRTALLLLDAVDPERLDSYAETIRGFVTQFGDESWFLVAKADAEMRSTHLERIRRELRATPAYGYCEASPWSSCYAAATRDHEFWTRELSTPATLFLARHKQAGPIVKKEEDDGQPPPKKQRQGRPPRRGYTGDDKSEKDDQGESQQAPTGGGRPAERAAKRAPRSPSRSPTGIQRDAIVKRRRKTEPAKVPEEHSGQAPSSSSKPTGKTQETKDADPPAPSGHAEAPKDFIEDKVIVDQQPPRTYGYWMHGKGDPRAKPWALILFSGKSRPGDIQRKLAARGWRVCAIDLVTPRPTNLLCDATWNSIQADIALGKFDAVWAATPCETFSPLREKRPGPRVLRTLDRIQGLPRDTLTQSEQKQLKESNILVDRTASAMVSQTMVKKPWGVENPDHGEDKPSLWHMPNIAALFDGYSDQDIRFDQCRLGLETTKPTRLMLSRLNLSHLNNLRCNHPVQTYQRPDGSTGRGPHVPTVQRWVTNEEGKQERASKSQGQYTSELSEAIAAAFHATQAGADWLKAELREEEVP
eukprot:s1011_g17.t1